MHSQAWKWVADFSTPAAPAYRAAFRQTSRSNVLATDETASTVDRGVLLVVPAGCLRTHANQSATCPFLPPNPCIFQSSPNRKQVCRSSSCEPGHHAPCDCCRSAHGGAAAFRLIAQLQTTVSLMWSSLPTLPLRALTRCSSRIPHMASDSSPDSFVIRGCPAGNRCPSQQHPNSEST
ncbi:hypothetical protein VTI74DRAFT_5430 [Chaetomium olivicolor]